MIDKKPYAIGLFVERDKITSESLLSISPVLLVANKLDPFSITKVSIPIITPTARSKIANKVLYSEAFNF